MSRSYYLYANKATKILSELRVSVFPLAFLPINGTLTAKFAGTAYTNIFTKGNELHFVHRDPREWISYFQSRCINEVHKSWMNAGYLGQPEDVVEVTYSYLSWNSTTRVFDTSSITENLTVAEDETETYYQIFQPFPTSDLMIGTSSNLSGVDLREVYTPRYGPTTVTDDEVEYGDQRGYANEFSIDTASGELVFHPRENLLINPAFEIVETSSNALHWNKIDSVGASLPTLTSSNSAATSVKAPYGDKTITIAPGQTIYQTVRPRSTAPHNISFHAQVPGSDSSIKLVVNPVDINGYYRDKDNTQLTASFDSTVEVFTNNFNVSSNSWNRSHAVIGASDSYFSTEGTVLGNFPASIHRLELRLTNPATNLYAAAIDAVQIHEGAERAPFLGILPKATIEYESDPDGVYQPNPSSNVFHRDDVNLNPLTSRKSDGFLALYEVGSVDDWQLGRGSDAIAFSSTTNIASLGRLHFPYAKTSGLGKLYERQTFHKFGWEVDDELLSTYSVVQPSDVQELAPENSYTDNSGFIHFFTNPSSNQVKDTYLTPLFYDQFGNPMPSTNVTVTHKGSTNIYEHVLVTDEVGRARFIHRPYHDSPAIVSSETVTFSAGNVVAIYHVDILT